MLDIDLDMRSCIDLCQECAAMCLSTAMEHHGEQYAEPGDALGKPEYFRLMMACAEICLANASVMKLGVTQHVSVCRACAEVCDACADSWEQLSGRDACVTLCRQCAERCRAIAMGAFKAA
jgi:hypothetical protein